MKWNKEILNEFSEEADKLRIQFLSNEISYEKFLKKMDKLEEKYIHIFEDKNKKNEKEDD